MRVKNGNLLHEGTVLFYRFEFFGKHDGIFAQVSAFGVRPNATCLHYDNRAGQFATWLVRLGGIADPPRRDTAPY